MSDACYVNRKWGLFHLKHLYATKFVFPNVFTIIETILAKLLFGNEKKYFRLTYVAQKRLCLSSLAKIQPEGTAKKLSETNITAQKVRRR